MRSLTTLFVGLGLGFLAAREYERLRDERAAIEAVERAETASMIGAVGPAPPPPGAAPENTQEAYCGLCDTSWEAVVEPGQTTVVCPNCEQPTEI